MMSKLQGHMSPRSSTITYVCDLCQHCPCSGEAGAAAWIALAPAWDLCAPVLCTSLAGVTAWDTRVLSLLGDVRSAVPQLPEYKMATQPLSAGMGQGWMCSGLLLEHWDRKGCRSSSENGSEGSWTRLFSIWWDAQAHSEGAQTEKAREKQKQRLLLICFQMFQIFITEILFTRADLNRTKGWFYTKRWGI